VPFGVGQLARGASSCAEAMPKNTTSVQTSAKKLICLRSVPPNAAEILWFTDRYLNTRQTR